MERTMVKQPTPPPQNPPPPPPAPDHSRPVNWNAPVTRGEFQQGINVVCQDINALDKRLSGDINALDKKLSGDINALDKKLSGEISALDKRLSGDINALDKRLVVVETKIEVLDEKVEEVRTDVKALSAKMEENHDSLKAEIKANSDTQRAERREDLRDFKTDIIRYIRILGGVIIGFITFAVTVGLALLRYIF